MATSKTMSADQIQEMIAAGIAAGIAEAMKNIHMGTVVGTPQVASVPVVKTMEQAVAGSMSNRFIGWMGTSTKTILTDHVAPALGKVEVLAVPVTLAVVANSSEKVANASSWLADKMTALAARSAAASIARTPIVK